jgi:hypothetical protein
LITAGIHGDEYEPMFTTVALARILPGALNAGTVEIVSVVNESAYRTGQRCGADGLDLARICPGNENGTISEVVAAQISALIREADYFIDLHTGGGLYEIYPLAGYMLHPDESILEQQRKMARAFNLPICWGTECSLNGRTLSVARDAGVPSIYVEFGGGGSVDQKVIDAYTKGCLNVLQSLKMITGERSEEALQYVVEDYTPAGGHLQIKMPSPFSGVFIPELELGAVVKQGQLWGTITSFPDGCSHEVFSSGEGLCFFLRRSVLVNQGDSLGGILPIMEPGKQVVHAK